MITLSTILILFTLRTKPITHSVHSENQAQCSFCSPWEPSSMFILFTLRNKPSMVTLRIMLIMFTLRTKPFLVTLRTLILWRLTVRTMYNKTMVLPVNGDWWQCCFCGLCEPSSFYVWGSCCFCPLWRIIVFFGLWKPAFCGQWGPCFFCPLWKPSLSVDS